MTNLLTTLLSTHDVLLADGATGTNLFNAGLMSGDAPEMWNDEHPEKIIDLYNGAIQSGSDIFLTNSFGANAARLKLHDAANQAHRLSRIAAEIARDLADKADRKIVVAGSVGPTGEIMEPVGSLTHALAVEMFHETADGLKAGGADVAWLETISAPEEYRAAAEGFKLAGIDWCGTMSFDTAGRTMMGVTSTDLVKLVSEIPNPPIAFGANCGTGASDLLRTVQGFAAEHPARPIIAKGNAGIPKYVDGHIHYDGTPELMADYAAMARDSGARIVGGCCGTTPAHLVAMREALDTRPRGDTPSLDEIVEALGAFSSDSDGTGDDAAEPRARRGGRRRRG
ncbi:betaine--homocysteine S-methyltransferase [Aliishimia ponticola]|uniref:Betaine--homocysteine S-methyltransferase n=1 Tax=Aliishimia ponticola TaxID=2499833 RepID=A0A4S4NGC5_9RHOB|nr:betaine--homocysteine S-methyltransferase [Aliishimia ponticola]THH38706.1 betaine--homocysteine S-methyltransferase [Aliishimia ponticola]